MCKFKVGDKVRITKFCQNDTDLIGDECVVLEVDITDIDVPYKVMHTYKNDWHCHKEICLELLDSSKEVLPLPTKRKIVIRRNI